MLVQLIAFTGQLSFFLVLAVYVQNGVGLTPLRSGVLFIAIGAGYVVTATASGAVAQRLGRQTVALGAVTMIAGLLLIDFGIDRIDSGHGNGIGALADPGADRRRRRNGADHRADDQHGAGPGRPEARRHRIRSAVDGHAAGRRARGRADRDHLLRRDWPPARRARPTPSDTASPAAPTC